MLDVLTMENFTFREFVHEDGYFKAVIRSQDVLEKGRLARTQEPSKNGNRHL